MSGERTLLGICAGADQVQARPRQLLLPGCAGRASALLLGDSMNAASALLCMTTASALLCMTTASALLCMTTASALLCMTTASPLLCMNTASALLLELCVNTAPMPAPKMAQPLSCEVYEHLCTPMLPIYLPWLFPSAHQTAHLHDAEASIELLSSHPGVGRVLHTLWCAPLHALILDQVVHQNGQHHLQA